MVGTGAWSADDASGSEIWLVTDGAEPVRFAFEDTLRDGAKETIAALKARGLRIELLSGDRHAAVEHVAAVVWIDDWRAECRPDDKVRRLNELAAQGRKVLMVGDGLNDAPALAAGHVSMSPAAAADVSQAAADLVFQGRSLAPVATAHTVAKQATRLVLQNFALAALYNVIAVPIAAAGLATPLVAAIAMSLSSLVVTLNALRLRLIR